ncbi:hypothetical protein CRUP_007431 [Coryphaenoides rupestris]|nr:hypothetical protein CRUP_007431 [Coryphaenoides rupestris]
MNIQRSPPINIARHGRHKAHDFEDLSVEPDQLQPQPRVLLSQPARDPDPDRDPDPGPATPDPSSQHCVSRVGDYLLLEALEGDHVFEIGRYQESLAAYFALGRHPHINQVLEVLLGESRAYAFFARSHGDMHSFVRTCKKLREDEAARLFRQIAAAVAHCHDNGLLESLEDTYMLAGRDDSLSDKHGCPAYVSPEILNAGGSYSGKAADVWSLGVMLYTILVGRYPFHDVEPGSLFSKIRRGHFSVPDSLTPKAKCLIRAILRREPSERLTSREILEHPWFAAAATAAAAATTTASGGALGGGGAGGGGGGVNRD